MRSFINRNRFLVILLLLLVTQINFAPNSEFKIQDQPQVALAQGAPINHLDYNPLLRIGLVQPDSESYIDEFAYFAMIPLFIFTNNSADQYRGPILYSNGDRASQYFLDDWYDFVNENTNDCEAIAIGNINSTGRMWFERNAHTKLHPVFPKSDPYTIAAQLSQYDWINSTNIIISPAIENAQPTSSYSEPIDLQFNSASTQEYSYSGTIGDSEWRNHSISFSDADGFVNGTLQWSPVGSNEALLHRIIDPLNHTRDYSSFIYSTVQSYSYEKPQRIRFEVNRPGSWKIGLFGEQLFSEKSYNIDLSAHPAVYQDVTIPTDASKLNVSISWAQAGKQIDIFLFDPDGNRVALSNQNNIVNSETEEFLSISNPQAGEWTIKIVLFDADNDNLQIQGTLGITTRNDSSQDILHSAANAAVFATMENAPLLYTRVDSLPSVIENEIIRLNSTTIQLIDFGSHIEPSVITELSQLATLNHIENLSQFLLEIDPTGNFSTAVISSMHHEDNEFLPLGAYVGAAKNAPVLIPTKDIENSIHGSWSLYNYPLSSPTSRLSLEGSTTDLNFDDRLPNRYDMHRLSTKLETWIADQGINLTSLQVIRTITPMTRFGPTLDRSLLGEYQTSRIPNEDPYTAAAAVMRGLFYGPLMSVSAHNHQALISYHAYSQGIEFTDNNQQIHAVNERAATEQAFTSIGFDFSSHTGDEATIDAANTGIAFWTISTHGTIFNPSPDRYITDDWVGLMFSQTDHPYGFELGGSPEYPDRNGDGIVNPDNQTDLVHHPESWMDQELGNIGSPIMTIVGCLVGSSKFPEVFLQHGAVSIVTSTRSIFFHSGGWANSRYIQLLTNNWTSGAALQQVINETSEMYSDEYYTPFSAWDLQFVLFGEPDISFADYSTIPKGYTISEARIDGHAPGEGYLKTGIITKNNALEDALDFLNHSYVEWQINSSIDDFIFNLPLLDLVIVESGVAQSHTSELEAYYDSIEFFVENGGTLEILGTKNASINWGADSVHGEEISSDTPYIILPRHPLVETPNNLTSLPEGNYGYQNVNSNWYIIAEQDDSPIWLSQTIGSGKICILTLEPDVNQNYSILENLLAWPQGKILRIENFISINFIALGESLVFELRILDEVYHLVESANVHVDFNSYEGQVNEEGDGVYTVTLPSLSYSLGRHRLNLSITKRYYDPASCTIEFSVYQDLIPANLEPFIFPVFALLILLSVVHSLRDNRNHKQRNRFRKKLIRRKEDTKDYGNGNYRIPLAAKPKNQQNLQQSNTDKNNFSAAFISEDPYEDHAETNTNTERSTVRDDFAGLDDSQIPSRRDFPTSKLSTKNHPDNAIKSMLGTLRRCVYCGQNLSSEDLKCPKCGMLNLA